MSMSRTLAAALLPATLLLPGAALAGDAAAGEREWRQCRSCHMIVSPAGETIQRGGRVGPNLYGIVGRQAGTVEGFRYSADLVAAGEAGLVWDEAAFLSYVADPTALVHDTLRAAGLTPQDRRSPMNYQMRSGAANMFAYLQSLAQ